MLGEEVRVAGGDDGVAHEEPGVAVIGVQPVALPRVVAEHDIRAQLADDLGDVAHGRRDRPAGRRRRRRGSGPRRPGAGQPAGRLALLLAAAGDERGEVGADVPRALRAVGADEVVDDAAGGGPLGQRAAGAELDVVGVGADRQRRAGHVVVSR